MSNGSFASKPQQQLSIWERLEITVISVVLLAAGVGLALRGFGGAPDFSLLRFAEGTVDNHEFYQNKSTRLVRFKLARSAAEFSFPDWAPSFEAVSELVTNEHAPVRVWYHDELGARSVWQVGSANAIIVSYLTMVDAQRGHYAIDRVFGVIFSAVGGAALATLVVRSLRRARLAD